MIRQAIEAKAKATALAVFVKYILPVLLAVLGVLAVIFIMLFAMDNLTNNRDYGFQYGVGNVSPEVLRYQPLVEIYASEYGVAEYVSIILAIMMQESGGRGNDPMQSSESLCGYVGCITDPEKSIEQGIKHFSYQLKNAGGDLKLAIQSYNFGGGFINYVKERGGSYTLDLAIEFSRMMFKKLSHTGSYSCVRANAPDGACYGDVFYVDSVFQYVNHGLILGGEVWSNPIAGVLQVNSAFGWRIHPINGVRTFHKGTDFNCIGGVTPIHSADNGTVVYSAYNNGGYGHLVTIQHGKGLYSSYAHLASRSVSVGQNVTGGQVIGICGSTGASTGPHLHFEAKSELWGGHFDPMQLIGIGRDD